jgi:hypothetical protein
MQSLHFMPASNQHPANNMSSPILPLELCELVIDLICDQDDLCTSSLVGKAFLPACHCRLFYRVHLFNKQIATHFFRSISSMLSPTSSYQYIQHLCLHKACMCPEHQWVNNALPLLSTLNVTILELTFVKWSWLDQTGQASLLSGFQEVKRLNVSFGDFDMSEQMC